MKREREIDVEAIARGVLAGERRSLARAITLIESARPSDQALADELLGKLLQHTGSALRVGFSGVPGAGKSTLIDTFGRYVIALGKMVSVLAVDPSSDISGGSILGDKTRMARLAQSEHAFIRPSPSRGSLGGASPRTPEAMLLCEAAGHDVVLVETVGVGQAEHAVSSMVDTFVLVLIAGAGDELQGMKRGVLEYADIVVINKADAENVANAERAASELRNALNVLRNGTVPVLVTSAAEERGIAELWNAVSAHRLELERTGQLTERRREQRRASLQRALDETLRQKFFGDLRVVARYAELEPQVLSGALTPASAAAELFSIFRRP